MSDLAIVGGRLTLHSGVPDSGADQNEKGTIYWTPYLSNHLALWDGSAWQDRDCGGELSLAVPSPGSGNTLPLDIWAKYVSGAVQLGYTWWASGNTRQSGYGLAVQNGVLVMEDDHEKRWLGSALAKHNAGGIVTDAGSRRHLFNLYNKLQRVLQWTTGTASWTYGTASWRKANADDNARVEYFNGGYNSLVKLDLEVPYAVNAGLKLSSVGIGKGDTLSPVGLWGAGVGSVAGIGMPAVAQLVETPENWGLLVYRWLEKAEASQSTTYYGSGYKSGLRGFVMN
jgi:hypothetical protein